MSRTQYALFVFYVVAWNLWRRARSLVQCRGRHRFITFRQWEHCDWLRERQELVTRTCLRCKIEHDEEGRLIGWL